MKGTVYVGFALTFCFVRDGVIIYAVAAFTWISSIQIKEAKLSALIEYVYFYNTILYRSSYRLFIHHRFSHLLFLAPNEHG